MDITKIISTCYTALLRQNYSVFPVNLAKYQRSNCYIISFEKYSALSGVCLSELSDNSTLNDGYFIPEIHGKKLIFYNSTMPLERSNFTLAHEIGHLELGHSAHNPENEKQADIFAGFLLMPDAIIRSFSDNGAIINEAFLVQHFRVSRSAAKVKLGQIKKRGLIKTSLDPDIIAKFSNYIRRHSAKLRNIDKQNSKILLNMEMSFIDEL